jgi:hypothetical protein
MQSPDNDTLNGQIDALEKYLDELDRKTKSTFAVTNPVTGVKNLEVGPSGTDYHVYLRDSNGNIIWGNHPVSGIQGFRMPLPMYPSIPTAGQAAVNTTWVDMWGCRTFVNSSAVTIQMRYRDSIASGATSEVRVQYDTGSGRVTMPGSTFSNVNANNIQQFVFTWPTDLFDTEIEIVIQGRIASGTGALMVSPLYILGGSG